MNLSAGGCREDGNRDRVGRNWEGREKGRGGTTEGRRGTISYRALCSFPGYWNLPTGAVSVSKLNVKKILLFVNVYLNVYSIHFVFHL